MIKLIIAAAALGSAFVGAGAVAAEHKQKLSGGQIRTRFAGMELTDEVHWRYIYDRDGTLRSYEMGTKRVGTWTVEKDMLCLYLNEPDDGCYDVMRSGRSIEMKPTGLGLPIEGVLQEPVDRK